MQMRVRNDSENIDILYKVCKGKKKTGTFWDNIFHYDMNILMHTIVFGLFKICPNKYPKLKQKKK